MRPEPLVIPDLIEEEGDEKLLLQPAGRILPHTCLTHSHILVNDSQQDLTLAHWRYHAAAGL